MVACGGNSGSGIFGEMPNIYREKIVEFALKGKSMAEDIKDCSHEEALAMLEEMREYVETVNEEIKTELTPHIDELKGTSIPCEVSDSVPYTLVGDMTITDVTLPKLKLTSSPKPLALHVEGAVVCTDTIYEYNEYFGKSVYMLMSTSDGEYVKSMTTGAEYKGERHFVIADASWGGTYEKACLFPGDTLNMKFKIEEEDMLAVVGRMKNGVIFSLDPSWSRAENKLKVPGPGCCCWPFRQRSHGQEEDNRCCRQNKIDTPDRYF